ncbi:MAG: heavy-metal-associated domain-containing protein [Ruminococcaceae bacterium]|nr:heavy-metal-associated domain-containing protein [Oscillospiraceae bacterium]
MTKIFKLENLDCANCAAKMERGIKAIDGVNNCTVSFMTQKMMLDADDNRFAQILELAKKAIAKVDPDCKIK